MTILLAIPFSAQGQVSDLEASFEEIPVTLNGAVWHMDFFDGKLYLTGEFDGGFAVYDPKTGETTIPDSGLKGTGKQFDRNGNVLYIVGDFIMSGSEFAGNITRFNLDTGLFEHPSGLESAYPLHAVTVHNDTLLARHNDGFIGFNTDTSTGEYLAFGTEIPKLISSAPDSHPIKLRVVDEFITATGNSVAITGDSPLYYYGWNYTGNLTSVLAGHPLPIMLETAGDNNSPVVGRGLLPNNEELLLRSSGDLVRFPGDSFIPGEVQKALGVERVTTNEARALHTGGYYAYVIALESGQVSVGRRIPGQSAFQFNNQLAFNVESGKAPFVMATLDGVLYFAGPVIGSNPEQPITVHKADLRTPTDWRLQLTAAEGTEISRTLEIGTSAYASDDFDLSLDREAPPLPPEGAFDARLQGDLLRDFRGTTTDETTWEINVIQSEIADPVRLEWSSEAVSDIPGYLFLDMYTDMEVLSVNMRSTSIMDAPHGETRFVIRHVMAVDIHTNYNAGWNLAGTPQSDPFDPFEEIDALIPESLFGFNGAYTDETTMLPGYGYWFKTGSITSARYSGPYPDIVQRELRQGWNLISGIWYATDTASIGDPGSIIVPGSLYEFNQGYLSSNTIEPGRGYWLQTKAPGTITIALDSQSGAGKRVPGIENPEGFLVFRVGTGENSGLEFLQGGNPDEITVDQERSFRMPPLPPNGAFDIRFSDNTRLNASMQSELQVQAPHESLTIAVSEQTPPGAKLTLELIYGDRTNDATTYEVLAGETISIDGFDATGHPLVAIRTTVTGTLDTPIDQQTLPSTVNLRQNYPNPFNPTTRIQFDLPRAGNVRLAVYDMLGQEIAVLVDENRSAGLHEITFDAGNLSSGTYLYRIETSEGIQTQKMLLIK